MPSVTASAEYSGPTRSRSRRTAFHVAIGCALLIAVLFVPDCRSPTPSGAARTPFVWNQDRFWAALETNFQQAKVMDAAMLQQHIARGMADLEAQRKSLAATNRPAIDPLFTQLETNIFELAAFVAAAPTSLLPYTELIDRVRTSIKQQSVQWNLGQSEVRQRLYRLLYGSRAAVEEAILQAPPGSVPELIATPAPYESTSSTAPNTTPVPSVNVRGVEIQSGDILVSRGGAATSALIARGNDYPGNFSHIALAYVDATTRQASVIEAHIESGVTISPIEQYFRDKKLRIMLLRLRMDLPQISGNPRLPHSAASNAVERARRHHIPYDFSMNHREHSKQFCSEVAAAAYEPYGIHLWMGLSHLSGRGITTWLALLGARYFETQEPSDLEYDPQLRVVAEWRDAQTLFQDHIDNAVVDAMLEGAERGDTLPYVWTQLPFARLGKAYSILLNLFGKVGPIPEGMNATAALRTKRFGARHARVRQMVESAAQNFEKARGYRPPYWELIAAARTGALQIR